MTLKALKNRFGVAEYAINFTYDCRYDTYTPALVSDASSTGEDNSDPLDAVTNSEKPEAS